MKVLFLIWISTLLVQEGTPSALIKVPRQAAKRQASVHTEYVANYEQKGEHGNGSFSTVKGKQEIVHDNCGDNWNHFAEKCASLIKDLIASLANAVSSRPGDATNLHLHIKNSFRHFDNTDNCTCLNHSAQGLPHLNLTTLLDDISAKTFNLTPSMNVNDFQPNFNNNFLPRPESPYPSTSVKNCKTTLGQKIQPFNPDPTSSIPIESAKDLPVNPVIPTLQPPYKSQPPRLLINSEDPNMIPTDSEAFSDPSAINSRRQVTYPSPNSDVAKPLIVQPGGNLIEAPASRQPVTSNPDSLISKPQLSPTPGAIPQRFFGPGITSDPKTSSSNLAGQLPVASGKPPSNLEKPPIIVFPSTGNTPYSNRSPGLNPEEPVLSQPQLSPSPVIPTQKDLPTEKLDSKIPLPSVLSPSTNQPVITPESLITEEYIQKPCETDVLPKVEPQHAAPLPGSTPQISPSPILKPTNEGSLSTPLSYQPHSTNDQPFNSFPNSKIDDPLPLNKPNPVESYPQIYPSQSDIKPKPQTFPTNKYEPIALNIGNNEDALPNYSQPNQKQIAQLPSVPSLLPSSGIQQQSGITPPSNGLLETSDLKTNNVPAQTDPVYNKPVGDNPISLLGDPTTAISKPPNSLTDKLVTQNPQEIFKLPQNPVTQNNIPMVIPKNINRAPPTPYSDGIQSPLGIQTETPSQEPNIILPSENIGAPTTPNCDSAPTIKEPAQIPQITQPLPIATQAPVVTALPPLQHEFVNSQDNVFENDKPLISPPLPINENSALKPTNIIQGLPGIPSQEPLTPTISEEFPLGQKTTCPPTTLGNTLSNQKPTPGIVNSIQPLTNNPVMPDIGNQQSGILPTSIPAAGQLANIISPVEQSDTVKPSSPPVIPNVQQSPYQKELNVLPQAALDKTQEILENGKSLIQEPSNLVKEPVQAFNPLVSPDPTLGTNVGSQLPRVPLTPADTNSKYVLPTPSAGSRPGAETLLPKAESNPLASPDQSLITDNTPLAPVVPPASNSNFQNVPPTPSSGPELLNPLISADQSIDQGKSVVPSILPSVPSTPTATKLDPKYVLPSSPSGSQPGPVPLPSNVGSNEPIHQVIPTAPAGAFDSKLPKLLENDPADNFQKPTTFQTTSVEPTPPQNGIPFTPAYIPTPSLDTTPPITKISENLPARPSNLLTHRYPASKEPLLDEDDEEEEDCCSCESCTEDQLASRNHYRYTACKDLEEARRELKAIFDKIKKKLKCGRKTPRTIITR